MNDVIYVETETDYKETTSMGNEQNDPSLTMA